MPKKITNQEFINKAKNIFPEYNYSLANYINAKTEVEIICPNCGKFKILPSYLLAGRGCDCFKNRYTNLKFKQLSNQEIEAITKKFPNFEIDFSSYKGSMQNVKIKCLNCGREFERMFCNLKSKNTDCPYCTKRLKTTDILKEELINKYGKEVFDFSKIEQKKNNLSEQTVKCLNCGREIKTNIKSLYKGFRCPFCCFISRGELSIIKILEAKGILFESQKRFAELGNLSYDFYLPKENLLIEFNGRQHYMPVSVFGGDKAFQKQVSHDIIKKKFAENKGIKLLTIPFYEKNLEEVINANIG